MELQKEHQGNICRAGQVGEQLGLFMYAKLFSSVIFGITALGY